MSEPTPIAKILQDEPLYRKIEVEAKYCYPGYLKDLTFQFFCKKEAANRTFKLTLAPEKAIETLSGSDYVKVVDPSVSENAAAYIHYFIGHCQSCKNYTVYFLLNVFSEGFIDKNFIHPNYIPTMRPNSGGSNQGQIPDGKVFMRK